MRALRLGIVVPYSWSYRGGVVEHAEGQALALRKLGVDATIVSGFDPPDRWTRIVRGAGRRTDVPPLHHVSVGRSVVVPTNGSRANAVLTPRAYPRMRRALEDGRFDILHLHEPSMPIPCMAALLHARVPLVGTFHAAGSVPWLKLAKPTYGFLLDRLDLRLAVSDAARTTAERFFPGRYEILPNGTSLSRTAESGGRASAAVFVGRHERRKGLPVLLQAWPAVRRDLDVRLRVIGADPTAVRRLMTRLGVSDDGIDLLGQISDQQLTRELSGAKLLVAPSLRNESFGMVLTRAFGCATPVLASDIAGYREIVTKDVGRLIPPGDPATLAATIVEMLADESARAATGAAARRVAERVYAWDRIAERLVGYYENLVPRSPALLAA